MTSTNNNNKDKIKNVLFMNGKEIKKNNDIKAELDQLVRIKDSRFVDVRIESVGNKTGNGSTTQRQFRLTTNPSARPISHVIAEYFPSTGKQTVITDINVGEAWTTANFAAITKEFIIMASVPGRGADLKKAFDSETSSKHLYNSQMFNTFVELTYPDEDTKLSSRKAVLKLLRDGNTTTVGGLIGDYMKKKKIHSREDMPSVSDIKAVALRTYLVQGRDGKYTHTTYNRDGSKKSSQLVVELRPATSAVVVDRDDSQREYTSKKPMYVARFVTSSATKTVTARKREDTKEYYYVTQSSSPLVLHMPFEVAVEKTQVALANEKKEKENKDFMEANGYVLGSDRKTGGRGGKSDETAKYDAKRREFALGKILRHSPVTYNVLINSKASLTAIAGAYNEIQKANKSEFPIFSDITESDMN